MHAVPPPLAECVEKTPAVTMTAGFFCFHSRGDWI